MGEETTSTTTTAPAVDQTYMVQVARMQPMGADEDGAPMREEEVWRDIAVITVPARTHRKTVLERALTEAGMVPEPGTELRVRVLDADSARASLVGSKQPPAQLVIGG